MKIFYLTLSLVFCLYLFDLGNPDALRQGTEGFYLQVVKEMFNKGSFLTPYHLNAPHWSKPPFLFDLAYVFYFIFGSSSLFLARLSVLMFSLFSFSVFLKSSFKDQRESSLVLLFFFSSLGFFKYSRIYMMEMPLALLSFIGAVYFFQFLKGQKRSSLIYSILFSTLSCLVKGPVSILMLGSSFFIFGIYTYISTKRIILKEIFYWVVPTIFLSSTWFIYQYYTFGNPFIEYFFLRENLGKFASKYYPAAHIFQGLLLYALPWSLLIPFLIKKYYTKGVRKLLFPENHLLVFNTICFICFFAIWFIPKQRSHHYAIPAIPFLLYLIYTELFKNKILSKKALCVIKLYLGFLSVLSILIIGLVFTLRSNFPNFNLLYLSFALIGICFLFILSFKKDESYYIFLNQIVLMTVIWSILIPNLLLPLVPNKIVNLSKNFNQIGTIHRKPFFVSEAIGKQVSILEVNRAKHFLNRDGVIILGENHLSLLDKKSFTVVETWPVWRRGLRFSEIVSHVKNKEIRRLKSKMFMIKARD